MALTFDVISQPAIFLFLEFAHFRQFAEGTRTAWAGRHGPFGFGALPHRHDTLFKRL